MILHAHVVDGEIERVSALPQQWQFADGRTTGNFDLLGEETHIGEGWLPVIDVEPEVPEGYVRGADTFTIEGDHVTRTWEVVAKPAPGDPPPDRVAELETTVAAQAAQITVQAAQITALSDAAGSMLDDLMTLMLGA